MDGGLQHIEGRAQPQVTRRVWVGNVPIGGGAPVSIQSMTNTDTADAESTLKQISALAEAGCDIVRVSVYNEACAEAVRTLVDKSPVPLVADIHFDHRLAIKALENGIHKLRINPGNIGGEKNVRVLADCLKMHRVPVRIGVNGGSLEKELLEKYGSPTPEALVESALGHARLLEDCGFYDIVLSMKCTNVPDTVRAGILASERTDYPLHIGVTEAGTPGMGNIKSAIGIGALLLRGIGDTVRVSLTGDPVNEVYAAKDILKAVGLRKEGLNIISCPTCGRTCIPVGEIAERVRKETLNIKTPLTVAVMGCVVNGPGEAREADIGIAGGKSGGMLFVKGQKPVSVKGDLAEILINAVKQKLGGAP
ncbi:MAG: flavodoxin-dependent (E)-4-hydroxy-3-methylbut-2-enyl-diphosphate synthase [Clostridia bacterium]|nr:flavodoxin-dependent (E)-4-hydroxy-3-methylbut-2-enyl-diphosphate synthase [Clostridia bacterium]